MDLIIHEIMKYTAVLAGLSSLIGIIPNIYLSIRLRKKRQLIMGYIISKVPERLQFRISFGVNANMSWVLAAYSIYIWFSYLFLRYGHHVTQEELKTWHLAIKQSFGRYFYLGLISAIFGNLVSIGMIIFIPLYIYSK